jgi:hypothetical protein
MSIQMSFPELLNAKYYWPAWFPERGKKITKYKFGKSSIKAYRNQTAKQMFRF